MRRENMMSERMDEINKTDSKKRSENPLATERIGKLIAKFAIPAVISMLVSSLYNIVDQIFIGQGVGMLGNAATNIAFPVSIICTATALMLGIGSASNYNLESGAGEKEKASRIAGTGLSMLVICGIVVAAVVLLFLVGDGDRTCGFGDFCRPVFLKIPQGGVILGNVSAQGVSPEDNRISGYGILYQSDSHGGGADHYE